MVLAQGFAAGRAVCLVWRTRRRAEDAGAVAAGGLQRRVGRLLLGSRPQGQCGRLFFERPARRGQAEGAGKVSFDGEHRGSWRAAGKGFLPRSLSSGCCQQAPGEHETRGSAFVPLCCFCFLWLHSSFERLSMCRVPSCPWPTTTVPTTEESGSCPSRKAGFRQRGDCGAFTFKEEPCPVPSSSLTS